MAGYAIFLRRLRQIDLNECGCGWGLIRYNFSIWKSETHGKAGNAL